MALRRWFAAVVFMAAAAPAFAQGQAPAPAPAIEEAPPSMRVLSETDAALYREIFALQENGNWAAADRKIAAVENDILMGYVQHQRYMHPTAYRSSFDELKRWMAYYADHPEADDVYSLARKRQPRGQSAPVRPIPRKWRTELEKELRRSQPPAPAPD